MPKADRNVLGGADRGRQGTETTSRFQTILTEPVIGCYPETTLITISSVNAAYFLIRRHRLHRFKTYFYITHVLLPN